MRSLRQIERMLEDLECADGLFGLRRPDRDRLRPPDRAISAPAGLEEPHLLGRAPGDYLLALYDQGFERMAREGVGNAAPLEAVGDVLGDCRGSLAENPGEIPSEQGGSLSCCRERSSGSCEGVVPIDVDLHD